MTIFSNPSYDNHEQVFFARDANTGLSAIIAVHDTTLGPALGGCRMWAYDNDSEALEDVLRLSQGMTYKAAVAGLNFGGGKAVIIGNARKDKTPALMQSFGRFVNQLGGQYITAEDVGTSPQDIEHVKRMTRHVAGTVDGSGDPSPATAWGVFHGVRAAIHHRFGQPSLQGRVIAIQGLGHVGQYLAQYLHDAGAKLIVTDINMQKAQEIAQKFDAQLVEPEQILDVEADLFAPCALGAVIDDESIQRLKVKAVAGAANNQLAETRHGQALRDADILYAPDYVINAGGIINISYEPQGYDKQVAFDHCARIYDTLLDIFRRADQNAVSTDKMADRIAEARLADARQARTTPARLRG